MDFTPILSPLTSLFSSGNTLPKDDVPITVMILSPHPDDECIVGSLALRLMFENNAHVVNVAVTLGSKVERQKARMKELEEACDLLEMELVTLSEKWTLKEKELRSLIQKYQPHIILAPHLKDHHPTHIKTGQLLKKCVSSLKKIDTLIVWTEFWGQNSKANVLIEVPSDILELQMNALMKHKGEVERNPYHLRLPAWMMDNVRRGSEMVSGTGTEASKMAFGVLYQWQLIRNGKNRKIHLPTNILTRNADLGSLIQSLLD
jgi:LmbE family N-acetylglucosaminyl deacetylase